MTSAQGAVAVPPSGSCTAPNSPPVSSGLGRDSATAAPEPVVDDYTKLKMTKKLGEGGFGTVWLAELPTPAKSKQVAVKVLNKVQLSPAGLKDFVKEVRLLRQLKHRHIVDFRGFGLVSGAAAPSLDSDDYESLSGSDMFLAQEYLAGGPVTKQVMKQLQFPGRYVYTWHDAFRWLRGVAAGLSYLHRGTSSKPTIIHRDLKPDNILLTSTDMETADAKLADFGLSRMMSHRYKTLASRRTLLHINTGLPPANAPGGMDLPGTILEDDDAAPPLGLRRSLDDGKRRTSGDVPAFTPSDASQARAWLQSAKAAPRNSTDNTSKGPYVGLQLTGNTGSMLYMAPEVYLKEDYNEKADIFSFGVIAYELLRYRLQVLDMHKGEEEEVINLAEKVSQGLRHPIDEARWPKSVVELVRRCWAQNPAERPSASQVLAMIDKIVADGDVDAYVAKYQKKRARKSVHAVRNPKNVVSLHGIPVIPGYGDSVKTEKSGSLTGNAADGKAAPTAGAPATNGDVQAGGGNKCCVLM
ncbi:unnamed protein product [Pedinophyceae sp. YPF-701]|nr:unnamed protein product [Pedinophyceae sp. YPF-701]